MSLNYFREFYGYNFQHQYINYKEDIRRIKILLAHSIVSAVYIIFIYIQTI